MAENIIQVELNEAIGRPFLNYALSVIIGRALPDVSDGLKPVQRRILYSMYNQGLFPEKAYRKSASTVGDVLGKLHPHGDSSVYEAMVNLAQDFSIRYPLVDGHGNFGSLDGDNAAAYRYTEARLTPIGKEMLKDIEKETVEFIPNFDDKETEPKVLPSMIPQLLANGSMGIAVGMATNIPPHNMQELYDAMVFIIDCTLEQRDPDVFEIMNYIHGPDFPTGAQIIGTSGIREAYSTGKGRFVIRGKYTVEESNNHTNIVISEIPYKVNKARLILNIHNLMKDGTIAGIKEVRDESDKDGIRIVVELKKDGATELITKKLLKHTELQSNFSVNNMVIVGGQPRVLNLKETLEHFIAHCAQVIIKRTEFDNDKAGKRLNIVDGFLRALENIDEIIAVIRNSDDASTDLLEMGFNKEQVKSIVAMTLGSLSKVSLEKLLLEQSTLEAEIVRLSNLLSDDAVLLNALKVEFLFLAKKYGDPRRTEIIEDESTIEEEDLVKEEMLVLTVSSDGLIKTVEEAEYRTYNRGAKGLKATNTRDDETVMKLLAINSKDDILFLTNIGRCHLLKAYKINKTTRAARGKSIRNYLNLAENETIVQMINTDLSNKDKHLLFVTKFGVLKRLPLSELSSRMSSTRVLSFRENDSLVAAVLVEYTDAVMIITSHGKSIRIGLDSESKNAVRPMGRTAAGVQGIRLSDDDCVVDMVIANNDSTIFTITEYGIGKRTPVNDYGIQGRGGKGILTHKIVPRTGAVSAAIIVSGNDELFVATEQGKVIRIDLETILPQGRHTSGVKIINLNEGDKVVSISKGLEEISDEENTQTE